MTDAELRDAAVAELKQTTVGWNKVANYSSTKLATTHWGKAMSFLEEIGTTEPPPPPPLPSNLMLTWKPPALSNPVTVNIPATGPVPVYGQQAWVIQLDPAKDYILNLGHRHETASGYAGLSIHGGRNIVMIGGEVEIALATSVQGDGQRDAFTFVGQTGTVHVEGVLFSGNPLRAFVTRAPGATFQFQNCRGGIRMGWAGSYDTTDHSDVILDQEIPSEERFDMCTFEYDNTGFAFYANGGTRKIKRTNLRNRPDNPTGHNYIHRNVVNTRMEIDDFYTETGWGFSNSGGAGATQFTLTSAWLFAQPAMALTGDGKSQGSFVTFTDPSGDNVSGNGIKYGSPPNGDFCPVGVAGVGYVSPGYQ